MSQSNTSKKTLAILAAGMGSRYGKLKQIAPLGPADEAILDYSIYDALQAGFNRVIFIIRPEIESAIRDKFQASWSDKIEVKFVHQIVENPSLTKEIIRKRQKPWGTAHALLCLESEINTPFAIINADDFYGRDAFVKAAQFLDQLYYHPHSYGLITYQLNHTLSEHGSVNRGICRIKEKVLESIDETVGIEKSNGQIGYNHGDNFIPLKENTPVSMNFWCVHHNVFPYANECFQRFINQLNNNIEKLEFYIPSLIRELILEKKIEAVQTLHTNASWFGVTYPEDDAIVKNQLQSMVNQNIYPSPVYNIKK